jgi:hypothetical protein
MPVKTGIQPRAYAIRPYKNSWIPGRATPDCDPGLPGMTTELFDGFQKQVTSHTAWKITAHL